MPLPSGFLKMLGWTVIWIAAASGFTANTAAQEAATANRANAAAPIVSALDDDGNPVDWWFIYKVPKLTKNATSSTTTGYEYLYYDPAKTTLALSTHVLDGGDGALNATLDSVFDNPAPTTGWVLYNDEMPASAHGHDKSSLGHTKGVIAFDTASKTAFWLLHSWPKYAEPGATTMPTPLYGQTFVCVSLDMDTAGKIAAQMANHQEPQVYLARTANLAETDPLFVLTKPLDPNAPADSDALDYTSRGGLAFKVIAKNRKWGKDFWNDLVGPTLQDDMNVETWIRGKIPPVLDSDGIHKTFDVKFIDMRPLGAPYVWPETHDHAKWGVTKEKKWICVGDINRMITQQNRGGGTIAFQDVKLWEALSKTDLLVPPPAHTDDEAREVIRATHKRPTVERRHATTAQPSTRTPSIAGPKIQCP